MAKAWGLRPSLWDSLSESDKAEMLAYDETIASMKSYEDFLTEQKEVQNRAKANFK